MNSFCSSPIFPWPGSNPMGSSSLLCENARFEIFKSNLWALKASQPEPPRFCVWIPTFFHTYNFPVCQIIFKGNDFNVIGCRLHEASGLIHCLLLHRFNDRDLLIERLGQRWHFCKMYDEQCYYETRFLLLACKCLSKKLLRTLHHIVHEIT